MLKPKSPLSVQFEITDNCNHKCRHCYNFWRDEDFSSKKINEDNVKKIINIGNELINNEVFHVILTGGEPLLLGENLERIIKPYFENNVGIRINSNITLVNDNIINVLKKYNVDILASIISNDEKTFDYVTQRKGSFNKFIEKAELLSNNDIYTSANMVVNKDTLNSVYDTGKLAASLGFKGFNATRVSPSNNGVIKDYKDIILNNEDIVNLLDQLLAIKEEFNINVGTLNALPYCAVPDTSKYGDIFNRSCVAGLTTCGINKEGDVRACQHFDINYGNLLEENLKEIWKKMPIWKEKYHNDSCNGCFYDGKCAGGCKENSYHCNNDMCSDDNLKTNIITKIENKEIKTIDKIRIKNGLKIRDESFGSIIFKNPAIYSYLDHFSTYIIKEIYNRKELSKKDLLFIGENIDYVDELYVDKLFNNLLNNNLAKEV
jgi:radical SAM protein with 4Fe4S-binding SPASM domain